MTDVFAVPGPPKSIVFFKPGSDLISIALLHTGKLAILEIMNSVLVDSPVGMRS